MRWLLLLLLAMNVATCGQKGPLELPKGRVTTVLADAGSD
ncbi:MAG: LPS translocon maturation chaperone LptM [Gammaproteobacteria bacterium]